MAGTDGELSFVAKMRDEASAVARTVRRNLDAAGGKARTITQKIEVDVDEARKNLGSFRDNLKDAKTDLSDVGVRMAGVMTKAGAAGPALLAAGAGLSALAAGGTAVIGALGPAAAAGIVTYVGILGAVKQAAGVAQFAMAGVAEAAGGDEKAMKKLSPAGQELAKTLGALKPKIESVRTAAQRGMFPGVEAAVTRLSGKYLPLFRTAARQTGDSLGAIADAGSRMAASGPWRRDFATVTGANAQNLRLMGTAGLNLANVARNLIASAMPLVRVFLMWAAGASASLSKMSDAGRESGKLAAFWKQAADVGATLGHILGNVGVALYRVFKIGGAGGAGGAMLKTLESITKGFRDWTASASGVEKIGAWFATGRDNLAAMGRLVRDVTGGLAGMGSGSALAPLIDQIRNEVVPPLMDFLKNASASGALSSLVSAVGQVVSVFAALSANDSSLKSFAATLGVLASSALWVVQNVPGAAAALGAFFTVAGAAGALKFVGLGGVVKALASGIGSLALKFIGAAAAESTETTTISANTIARRISTSTLGTWIGVKALELGAWLKSLPAMIANTAALVAHKAVTLAISAATKAWAVVQWAMNAALTANPIGLVVVAIAALVAGIIYAWKHSETFRTVVLAVWAAIKGAVVAAVHAITGAITAAWSWIKSASAATWGAIKGAITGAWQGIKSAVSKAVSSVVDFVKSHWRLLIAIVLGPLGIIVGLVISHWGRIKSFVSGAISAVRGAVSSGFSAMRGAVSGAMGAIRGAVSGAWNAIKNAFSSAVDRIVGIMRGLKGRVMGAIGSFADVGRNIISGIVSGIGSMASTLLGKVSSVINGAKNKAKSLLGIHSPSKVFHGYGVNTILGFVNGIGEGESSVNASIDKVFSGVRKWFAARIKTEKEASAAAGRAIAGLKNEAAALVENGKAHDRWAEKMQAAVDFGTGVRDKLREAMDVTSITGENDKPVTATNIVAGLAARLAAIKKFQADLGVLRRKGFDEDMIRQIAAQGVDAGGATATALATATAAQVKQINAAEGGIASAAADTGRAAAAGLVAGVASQLSAVDAIGKTLANRLRNAVRKELKIKSPSRRMMEDGQHTANGLAAGIIAGIPTAETAAANMARRVASAATPTLTHLTQLANASAFRPSVTTRSSEVVTIRHEVVSPDGSVTKMTADEVADLIARDPKSASKIEGALRPARRKKSSNTISSSR